jgi:hypothetical protein
MAELSSSPLPNVGVRRMNDGPDESEQRRREYDPDRVGLDASRDLLRFAFAG